MKTKYFYSFTYIITVDILGDNPYLSKVFEIIYIIIFNYIKAYINVQNIQSSIGGFLILFYIIQFLFLGLRFHYKDSNNFLCFLFFTQLILYYL